MDRLWSESGQKAASNNLRQTRHAARRALTSDPSEGSRYLDGSMHAAIYERPRTPIKANFIYRTAGDGSLLIQEKGPNCTSGEPKLWFDLSVSLRGSSDPT
jgi:hypothetical protein